jgi:hypothetical protein
MMSAYATQTMLTIREDFTGDGIRDLAVYSMSNGRTNIWRLFVGEDSDTFKYAYTIDFDPKAFRIYSSENETVLVTFHATGAEKGSLVHTRLSAVKATRISSIEITSGDVASEKDKILYNKHFSYLLKDPRTKHIAEENVHEVQGMLTIEEGKQDSADQPATAPESKPDDKEKPKKELERRSQ